MLSFLKLQILDLFSYKNAASDIKSFDALKRRERNSITSFQFL